MLAALNLQEQIHHHAAIADSLAAAPNGNGGVIEGLWPVDASEGDMYEIDEEEEEEEELSDEEADGEELGRQQRPGPFGSTASVRSSFSSSLLARLVLGRRTDKCRPEQDAGFNFVSVEEHRRQLAQAGRT